MKAKLSSTRVGSVMGALLTTLVGAALFFGAVYAPKSRNFKSLTFGTGLVDNSYDLPLSKKKPTLPPEAVIIYMDEQSHRELDQPFDHPWSRALHARLIEKLKADGVKVIVFDVMFTDASTPEVDEQFIRAIQAQGKVVIGADLPMVSNQGNTGLQIMRPYEPILKASVGCGLVALMTEMPGYSVRRFYPGHEDADGLVPCLAWKAAEAAGAKITGEQGKATSERWANYYGPPYHLLNLSYAEALTPEGTPPGFFRDKVVFIGERQATGFAGAGKDEFGTPYGIAPGVEIHATMFLNLLRTEWLTRMSATGELLLLLIFGAVLGAGFMRLHPLSAAGLAVLVAVLIGVAGFWLMWSFKVWFAWGICEVQVLAAAGWAIVYNSIKLHFEKQLVEAERQAAVAEKELAQAWGRAEQAEKEKEKAEKERALEEQRRLEAEQKVVVQEKAFLRESLTRLVSPARADQLLARPELLKPHTEKQTISILFSDIEAYSKLSGVLSVEDLAGQLNSYYETALECIHATDGTVVNLIGDAIFAIWNAPLPQADHREQACRAGLLLVGKLREHDARHPGPPLKTRVGLHVGEASVGNIGSKSRFNYTAVGDAVNIAARLEGLNKHLGTWLLATREIQRTIETQMVCRQVGLFRFKGVQTLKEVYELIGLPQDEVPTRAWREAFDDGMRLFRRRQWEAAEAAFRRTIELRDGQDGPASYYLKRIAELRLKPPADDWMGEIVMEDK